METQQETNDRAVVNMICGLHNIMTQVDELINEIITTIDCLKEYEFTFTDKQKTELKEVENLILKHKYSLRQEAKDEDRKIDIGECQKD